MASSSILSLSFFFLLVTLSHAATFEIVNRCPYTVWAAATGDCGGVLACTAYGSPPNTLAEFALNQFNNLDFFDISLVDGFNVPMDFSPTSGGCRGIRCAADINGQNCPDAYSYPKDDQTSTFTCPGGANYRVVFCP
ncbi:hypothetical protein GW17_00044120 [Ensete ventricosum]|nr:hypothetical protein GW17_00044120 [Ensete ventricosum]